MTSLLPKRNWILDDNNPLLRERSAPVVFPVDAKTAETIKKMKVYVDASFNKKSKDYDITPGIGIAAPQVGHLTRMFYIRLLDEEDKEQKLLIANPVITSKSSVISYLQRGEGCLSVPVGHDGVVPRSAFVTVEGVDPETGKKLKVSSTGIMAICIQHEYDHLEGVLYYDRINSFEPQRKEKEWIEVE